MKYIQSQPIEFTDPDIGRSSSGHKFHNWITGLYLSKLFNLEYVYSPFTQDAERYESFLNLSSGWNAARPGINVIQIPESVGLDFCHDPNTPLTTYSRSLAVIEQLIKSAPEETLIKLPANPLPGLLTQYRHWIVGQLQQAYWAVDREVSKWWNPSKINIAIHIRRGDITNYRNPDRWLDLDYYRDLIDRLIARHPDGSIVVFSEGHPEQFVSLERPQVEIVLGGSDLAAFDHMALADILVTGQSSWSIMASYFNRGTVLITPLKNFMYKWEELPRILLASQYGR